MKPKALFLSLLIIALSACSNREHTKSENPTDKKASESSTAENRNCIESFKKFRDDIYQGRKEMVQSHFSFPITDTEIWYAVQDDDLKSSKNFTENDFNTYYDQLFPKKFVQSLLKIKSQELFNKGYYETPRLSKKEGTLEIKNYVIAMYDKKTGELIFSYNYEYYEEGNKTESANIYYFTFDNNCNITFKKLMMAG